MISDILATVPVGALVFARISGLLLLAPLFGGGWIPVRVRALLTLALTFVLTPLALARPEPAVDAGLAYALAMMRELTAGFVLGLLVECLFAGVRFGGDLVARFAGFSASENFDPTSESFTGPTGDLYALPLMVLFLATDGHHHLIAALASSFAILPLGAFTVTPALAAATVEVSSQVFTLALAVSWPVLLAITAITVAEGVIARAVPQINILHVSFAAKILGSMLVMWLGVPAAVAFLGQVLYMVQALLQRAPGLLG